MREITKLMRLCWVGVMLAIFATAINCNNPKEVRRDMPAAVAGDTSDGDWHGFDRYPHARLLCSEHVLGFDGNQKGVEINWTSFAVSDATERAIAFYSQKSGGKIEAEGKSTTIRQANSENILSVYPADETGYPTCDKKPRPDERTVIVVSTRIGP